MNLTWTRASGAALTIVCCVLRDPQPRLQEIELEQDVPFVVLSDVWLDRSVVRALTFGCMGRIVVPAPSSSFVWLTLARNSLRGYDIRGIH